MTILEDFGWWLALAPTLEWTVARTYAQTAPHGYVVHPRTAGMTKSDYVRAAHAIHTFGEPAKFYSIDAAHRNSPEMLIEFPHPGRLPV
jgi:hypothetical protein